MDTSIVILAAGQGTRMRSDLPKVLHPLAGRPLLAHVVDTAQSLRPRAIHVVYGHGGDAVREALAHAPVHWVEQAEQLGTGHAVAQALPQIPDDDRVLVLYGDVPLIAAATLRRLAARGRGRPGAADRRTGRPERLRPHTARRAAATLPASSNRRMPTKAGDGSAKSIPASWPCNAARLRAWLAQAGPTPTPEANTT